MATPEVENGERPSVSETTPLMVASGADLAASKVQDNAIQHQQNSERSYDEDDTPLPKLQIALLCYARIVEPIAYFSIFPFINEMVQVTGNLEEADVGFYTGLIESLFSVTQMFFMIPWGRAADRWGRKPVLVISLIGVAIATALFGLSTELWQMILFRCIGGAFAGTVVTVRTMLSENSTPKTQARAFSWFAFASNLGIFAGPFIGGVLSNPAKEFPSLFGHVQFFKDFPYALPTIITGSIGATAAISSALFIKETLTPDRITSHKASAPMTTWELIRAPGVAIVILIYGHVMLLAYAFTSISSIFQFTDAKLGGFGFSNFQISLFIALAGISQALWTLLVFTPLQHRFGTGGVLRACAVAWPLTWIFFPFCNLFLRNNWMTTFWIVAPIANVLGSGVSMAFTAVQLALNDIAPTHATLGTLNGIALAVGAGLRAIAPALFASIFATGVKHQIFGGYLIWVVLILLASPLIIVLRWLPAKAEGKLKKLDSEEEH